MEQEKEKVEVELHQWLEQVLVKDQKEETLKILSWSVLSFKKYHNFKEILQIQKLF